jgi:hypothetical protein
MHRSMAHCTPCFPYRLSTTLGSSFGSPTTGTGCTIKSGIQVLNYSVCMSNETVPMEARTPAISYARRPPTESRGHPDILATSAVAHGLCTSWCCVSYISCGSYKKPDYRTESFNCNNLTLSEQQTYAAFEQIPHSSSATTADDKSHVMPGAITHFHNVLP